MIFLKYLLLLISVLLMIAFFTLFERKILSYMQMRKGPNLVGPLGLLQPFADGLKLMKKIGLNMSNTIFFFFWMSPLIFFFLSILMWMFFDLDNISSENNFMILLLISSLAALFIFFSGWGSGSKYSLMGGIRASAQMISYEVIFSFGFLCFLNNYFFLNFHTQYMSTWGNSMMFLNMGILAIMIIMILAETNRSPFDLTEGESELVSGFNTEFPGVLFVFLFLGEYSFICLFSFLLSLVLFNQIFFFFLFMFTIIWMRASFPRKRYDILMMMMWVQLFPFICSYLWMSMLFWMI